MEARERIERMREALPGLNEMDNYLWLLRVAGAAVEACEKGHDHIVGQYGYLFACSRCKADVALVAAIEDEP